MESGWAHKVQFYMEKDGPSILTLALGGPAAEFRNAPLEGQLGTL